MGAFRPSLPEGAFFSWHRVAGAICMSPAQQKPPLGALARVASLRFGAPDRDGMVSEDINRAYI